MHNISLHTTAQMITIRDIFPFLVTSQGKGTKELDLKGHHLERFVADIVILIDNCIKEIVGFINIQWNIVYYVHLSVNI